jgi:hypothetical protein
VRPGKLNIVERRDLLPVRWVEVALLRNHCDKGDSEISAIFKGEGNIVISHVGTEPVTGISLYSTVFTCCVGDETPEVSTLTKCA